VSERLSRERLDTIIRMIVSARGPKVADEIADHIAALEAEVSELLPMADVAGWWQGEFQIANVDRNELRAENERLRSTLAAKETVQRANEDEMSADNERLRDALLGIVGLPDVHAKELEIAVDALAALDKEVGE
jgi:regulator of replication initiation timing